MTGKRAGYNLYSFIMKFRPAPWMLGAALGGAFATCDVNAHSDIVVDNRVFTSGETKAFWATYTVQTMDTVTVQSGADVRFQSGGIIRLAPGFSVQAGGVFQAKFSSGPGYDPGGYYNGQSPTVAPLSPHVIYGAAGAFNNQVLDVAV